MSEGKIVDACNLEWGQAQSYFVEFKNIPIAESIEAKVREDWDTLRIARPSFWQPSLPSVIHISWKTLVFHSSIFSFNVRSKIFPKKIPVQI